jgi:hypothetical protein
LTALFRLTIGIIAARQGRDQTAASSRANEASTVELVVRGEVRADGQGVVKIFDCAFLRAF